MDSKVTLREAAQQALEALEKVDKEFRKYGRQHWPEAVKARAAIAPLRAALAEPVQEPDLSRCPKCGGPADNGHDRSIPPSPYFCTKCMAEPYDQTSLELCEVCGWKTLIPGDCCLNCARINPCPNCASLEAQNTELDRRLAELERGEPVAWRWGYRSITTNEMDWRGYVEIPAHPSLRSPEIIMEPLYTAPPQRKPLTDEALAEIIDAVIGFNSCWGPEEKFARAIERAHKIGDE